MFILTKPFASLGTYFTTAFHAGILRGCLLLLLSEFVVHFMLKTCCGLQSRQASHALF